MIASPTRNWAGNVTYRARRVLAPTSLDELCALVAGSDRIRALGSGHSFSLVADSTGDLVTLTGLPQSMEVAADRSSVTVPAAMRYGELAVRLEQDGLALPNLASLPHIGIAGAVATGTHGSGATLGSLASAVAALEMVTATGEVVTARRRGGGLPLAGLVVGLGAVGVVTRVTLDVEPSYAVRQLVYDQLPWATVEEHFDDVMSAAYSVSLFTRWHGDHVDQVWVKQREADDHAGAERWMGGTLADGPRHPILGMAPEHCTEQGGVPGPWYDRLPHFRLAFTPSAGDELQSEYVLPRDAAVDAIRAIHGISDRVAPLVQVSEIRTVAADDLWLSPSADRDSVAIHFTWRPDDAGVRDVLPLVEERLGPLGARPHWGKLFTMEPVAVATAYERLPDFARLRDELDPTGKFNNDFVERYVDDATHRTRPKEDSR